MLGNINKIKQYIIKVKNISPLRIGNGEEEGNGLLIYDSHAIINGTTLSGLFRKFLKKIEMSENNEVYKLIFPKCNDENDKKEISKIYFYDSVSNEKLEKDDLCCRDHVRIDEDMESSVENHLFKEYHISVGKTFELFFEVRGLELEEEKYNSLCDYLEKFIKKIAIGQIYIGSKSSFGFGRFKGISYDSSKKNSLYYKEYDLSKEDNLNKYLEFNREEFVIKDFESLHIDSNNNNDNKIKVKLKVYCDEGFIIKGNSRIEEKNIVDYPYKENINGEEQLIIPSSTIKGVVKSYCNKIFETLGRKDKKVIVDMFGEKADEANYIEGKKAKLIFKDCRINEENLQIYNRIKIDRFTGGVMTGGIFKEYVAIVSENNPIEFNVILNKEDRTALALIILSFRDIALGYLTIGSGNNIGYGRFKGKSLIVDGAGYNSKLDFEKNELKNNIEKIRLKGDISEFNEIINIL